MAIPHWKARPTLRPPDARDCPYPLAGLPESPAHDWAAIATLLEELIEDDNIRQSTLAYLESFYHQLESRGSLSDKQVGIIREIEQRRDREGKRGF